MKRNLISMNPMVINNFGLIYNKNLIFFLKRQFAGGLVMVWAAIAAGGTTPIVFMHEKLI